MEEAISVQNVFKDYRSRKETVHALNGVSLSVKEGEIFGLLGPNGAGKTTLISILVGILSPDNGSAKIFGKDCSTQARQVQEQINVVSGFSGAIGALSVEESLTYYAMLYNVGNPKETIERLLRQMDLYDARDWVAEYLSSGMRQRFFICRGLLNDPKVLILDEPTVGLDVESAIAVRNIIRGLRKEGRTVLLTTHNMFEAQELCDRIAFINGGKILSTGTPAELKGRLSGERVIEIHCSEEKCVVDSLRGLKGVTAEIKSAKLVHVKVDSYSRTRDIMRALADCGGDIYSVSEMEPSFEEVYLNAMRGGNDE